MNNLYFNCPCSDVIYLSDHTFVVYANTIIHDVIRVPIHLV